MIDSQDENTQTPEPGTRMMRCSSLAGIFGLTITFLLNFLLQFSYSSLFALITFAATTVLTWLICFSHLKPSARWKFFGTTLGKKICWYFYVLSVLNMLRYLNSTVPAIFACFSISFIISTFLFIHTRDVKRFLHNLLDSQLSLAAILEFYKFQCLLRPFSIFSSFALATYAILLPAFCFHHESHNIAAFGFFFLTAIMLIYWFLETKIKDADVTPLQLYWMVYGLTIHKLVCSYILLWLCCKINFASLAKLELFGLFIAGSLWILAVLELIALAKISAVNQPETPSENEDEEELEPGNQSFTIIVIERAGQLFCLLFGVSLFSFVTQSGLGISHGFFLFSLALLLVYWHYHPLESFFIREATSHSKFCNSWNKAFKAFVTGHCVFFLKNEANAAKSIDTVAEEQLYSALNILGYLAVLCFTASGLFRVNMYAKKHASAADVHNEEESHVVSSNYQIRNTPALKLTNKLCKVFIDIGHAVSVTLSVLLAVRSHLSETLSLSRRCVLNWAIVTTAVAFTPVTNKVAYANAPDLTRVLMKGISTLGLALWYSLLVRIQPISADNEPETIFTVCSILYYTTLGIYAIGGFGLIILHGLKLRMIAMRSSFSPLVETSVIECTAQSTRETEASLETNTSDQSLDSSMIQTTPRIQTSSTRRSSGRRIGNRRILSTAGSRYVRLVEDRGQKSSATGKDSMTSKEELSSYYQAFSTLAKGNN